MNVNLPQPEENFYCKQSEFCGIGSYLITPKFDAVWTKSNLFYRSLIINQSDGKVLSSGWPKFFNQGEKTELYPNPKDYNDWTIHEKIDGSLVIVDWVNDVFSIRTRGCFSYLQQQNSNDFELLAQKYPAVIEFLKHNSHLSLLFEIVTPNNIIVIRPTDIEFYFLGAINKNTLQVLTQQEIKQITQDLNNNILLPTTLFNEQTTNNSLLTEIIKQWKGKEGVVISYNENRNRIKVKSDWYLFCHRIKSELNSSANLIEYYINSEMLPFDELIKKIETEFDFEIAKQIEPELIRITSAGELAKRTISNITEAINGIRNIESRKTQAEMIKRNFQATSSYAFCILDNNPLNKQQWIKLTTQFYEKLQQENNLNDDSEQQTA
jgi:hypothetical protein